MHDILFLCKYTTFGGITIIIEERQYKGFGKCLFLQNDTAEVAVTLEFGPRIVRYALKGGENEFYEEAEFDKNAPTNELFSVFGDEGIWHMYGGHRLWMAPEQMPRTNYPDNRPVEYCVEGNTAIFMPPTQKFTGFAVKTYVTLAETGTDVKIEHHITNCGAWPVETAPWAITVMAPGGIELIPQPTRNTGLLSNRLIAVWPYSRLTDNRLFFGDRYITLRQDVSAETPFKIGINSEHGWAAYFNRGHMFIKRFAPCGDKKYPDGGMSYETYTNSKFIELESLGEMKVIKDGETAVHTETWQLIDSVDAPASDDESAMDSVVKKYIKIHNLF